MIPWVHAAAVRAAPEASQTQARPSFPFSGSPAFGLPQTAHTGKDQCKGSQIGAAPSGPSAFVSWGMPQVAASSVGSVVPTKAPRAGAAVAAATSPTSMAQKAQMPPMPLKAQRQVSFRFSGSHEVKPAWYVISRLQLCMQAAFRWVPCYENQNKKKTRKKSGVLVSAAAESLCPKKPVCSRVCGS